MAARRTTPLEWTLRVLLAAVVVVSGLVHLDLWNDGMRSVAVVGPAFLVQGLASIVLGVLLLGWRHWLPLLGAVGFGAASLLPLVVSTLPSGFFGVHERWAGAPVWTSVVTEAAAVVLGVCALLAYRRTAPAATPAGV